MYVSYESCKVKGASAAMQKLKIAGVVAFCMDITGVSQTVYVYVIPNLAFLMILGNLWKAYNKIKTALEKR
jgi:hypothetical protein